MILPIILQILGIAVIIAEVVLPSGGILSVAAVALLGYSIYHVFAHLTPMAGTMFVVADIFAIPLAIVIGLKLLAKSPVTLRSQLQRGDGGLSPETGLAQHLGQEGVTLTDLRPSGMARIGGKRVDVVSRGDYIEKGSPVKVTAVEGNQVIVRRLES